VRNFPLQRMQQPEIESVPHVLENPLQVRAKSMQLRGTKGSQLEFVYDMAVPGYMLISAVFEVNTEFFSKDIVRLQMIKGSSKVLNGRHGMIMKANEQIPGKWIVILFDEGVDPRVDSKAVPSGKEVGLWAEKLDLVRRGVVPEESSVNKDSAVEKSAEKNGDSREESDKSPAGGSEQIGGSSPSSGRSPSSGEAVVCERKGVEAL
jgi:hypothetical protein